MSLAQNSNASDAKNLISRAGAERLPCVDRKGFGSFYRLHDRVVLGFTRKFWFSIQGKPILYFKGLSFGYFSPNRYATDRVTACSVLFILFALVSSFADKNRSWFFAQRYQLLITTTTTTITRDTLFYRGNLFNIAKMFSHYFQDTRERVTGFCG